MPRKNATQWILTAESPEQSFNGKVRRDIPVKLPVRARRLIPLGLLRADDQRPCDHVVQRLLTLSESRHDVADQESHAGKVLGEIAATGASKRDTPSCEIGDFQPHFP